MLPPLLALLAALALLDTSSAEGAEPRAGAPSPDHLTLRGRELGSGSGNHHNDDAGSATSDAGANLDMLLLGVAIWFCVPPCLWNNEKIVLKQARVQGKARNQAIIVTDPSRTPIDELEGHILYVEGRSTCDEIIRDEYFPSVQARDCIKLRRVVEMYQWVEEQHATNPDEFTYKMDWNDSEQTCPNDIRNAHINPKMPISSTTRSSDEDLHHIWAMDRATGNGSGNACAEASATSVRLGAYYCGDDIRRELKNWKAKTDVEKQMLSFYNVKSSSDGGLPSLGDDGWWYYGNRVEPVIGDFRIRFEELRCGSLAICGVASHTFLGWTLMPVVDEEGDIVGESLAQEFGCSDHMCPWWAPHHLKFTARKADDAELIRQLDRRSAEFAKPGSLRFQPLKDASADEAVDISSVGFCCVCCFSNKVSQSIMNFFNLEEQFLGVTEQPTSLEHTVGGEGRFAKQSHHIVRLFGWLLGLCACWLIFKSITSLLFFTWLVYLLGGSLLGASCVCSLFVTVGIISAAWWRHRPRMTIVIFLSTFIFAACVFAIVPRDKVSASMETDSADLTHEGGLQKHARNPSGSKQLDQTNYISTTAASAPASVRSSSLSSSSASPADTTTGAPRENVTTSTVVSPDKFSPFSVIPISSTSLNSLASTTSAPIGSSSTTTVNPLTVDPMMLLLAKSAGAVAATTIVPSA